ncbi:unnamed protein product, partial [Porites evermanni]
VRGISNFLKRRMIFTWCRKQKTDFFFLQETHSKSDTETQWKNEWGGEIILSHGSPNSCGVAILLKKGVDCVIHSKILDSQGRYIILKAEIKDKMYVLINIYAPNKDTCIIKFLNTLLFTLRKENLDEEENIILGGDFNCPLNPFLDKKGGILTPRKSVMSSTLLIFGELKILQKKVLRGVRTLQCLYDSVTGTDIFPAIKTDHSAILLEFCNNVNDIKGPGYWKMNCSLLEDDDYINDITAKIPVWLAEGYKELSDNRNIWDWIKYNIRINAIQHSKRKAKERNDKEKSLQNVYAKAKQN